MTFKEFRDWLLDEQQKALKDYFPFDFIRDDNSLDEEGQRLMIQAWTDCLKVANSFNGTASMSNYLSNTLNNWRDYYEGSRAYDYLESYYEPIIRYVLLRIQTDVSDDDRAWGE